MRRNGSRARRGSTGVGALLLLVGIIRVVAALAGGSGSQAHVQLPTLPVSPEVRLSECLQQAGSAKDKTRACFATFENDRQQQQLDCGTTTDPTTGLPPLPGDPTATPAVPPDPINCPPGFTPP
jgi:hypothetical protein